MKMKNSLLIFALLVSPASFAQQYSIDWYKIADGGGASTGGVYTITGTIGQHDASGPMTGGNFSLTGGFWPLYVVQTPGTPWLSITLEGGNVVLSWPASATGSALQQTPALVPADWTSVTNSVSVTNGQNRVTIPSPAGVRFYRLQSP
jgi:hypothetical protein